MHGNLLKVDAYGNILVCVHGFNFLRGWVLNHIPAGQMCTCEVVYIWLCTRHTRRFSLCLFLFFRGLRSGNVTQTSSSRETTRSAFISLTHSSTCQVGPLSTEGEAVGLLKTITMSERRRFIRSESWLPECVYWRSECWRRLPARLFPSQRPTSLLVLWISSPTVTDTLGEEPLVNTPRHATRFWPPHGDAQGVAGQTGWRASPAAWEGPGVSSASLR